MATHYWLHSSAIRFPIPSNLGGIKNAAASGSFDTLSRTFGHCIPKALPISEVFGSKLNYCVKFNHDNLLRGRLNRKLSVSAVFTSQAPSLVQTNDLKDGSLMEVKTFEATPESRARIEIRIRDGSLANVPLILHWGATSPSSSGWTLPGWRPDGTKNYKNRALQSPFVKEGNSLLLCIEIADPKLDAIEFTLKNEADNTWYNFNNGNFRIPIPESSKINIEVIRNNPNIVVPEELVQIQAYLRWEKNGKQNYSKEKEQEEYELGRRDLQAEIASGVTLAQLRARLLGEPAPKEVKVDQEKKVNGVTSPEPLVPDDLVSIQAYIRWERAGKQNYSAEKQKIEFEEARKDLQREVLSGKSIESIRKTLTSGSDSAPPKLPQKPISTSKIARNKWDTESLINRYEKKTEIKQAVQKIVPEKEPSPLELGAQIMEGVDNNLIVFKQIYPLGDKQLLVLVTNPLGEPKVRFATDMKEEVSLHWGVASEKGNTWMSPPRDFCSVELEGACESNFNEGFAGDPSLQSLELNFERVDLKGAKGISFVLKSGGNWFKSNGSDFYVPLFSSLPKLTLDSKDLQEISKPISDEIINQESEAQRSLMHRFNIGSDILSKARSQGELGLAAVLVWFRFMTTRQLVWNKNYNVKPREISAAQDRLTNILQDIYNSDPSLREFVRLVMMCVGRGGEGDMGQRIRDEILVIQRANDCKGGMMEEWHQKLHNNTSPDDVVICQALLDYINSGFSIDVYWKTLNSNGVSRERLKSYDRPIVSEPSFRPSQREGLIRDLNHYMKTLKAVHSGADLESAIAKCMGYKQGEYDFMKSLEVHPIDGLSSRLPSILKFVLEHIEDKATIPLLEGLIEARRELRPSILTNNSRLKDIIFLDLSLDSSVRTVIERGLENLANASAQDLIYIVSLVVENLCLSIDRNEELVYCLKGWHRTLESCSRKEESWALKAKAVMDRTRLFLADKSEHYQRVLQPTAVYIGSSLNVDQWAIQLFTEEIIRSGSAASLSIILNRLDPVLRKAADMGSWQIISPAEVKGFVYTVNDLGTIQDKVFDRPTVVIANHVKGEEEIPSGVVGLITLDMPDILSHVSVRARNEKICFATCFDEKLFSDLLSQNGSGILLRSKSSELEYIKLNENDMFQIPKGAEIPKNIQLSKKKFGNKFAIRSNEFHPDFVGAKSRNISGIRGKLPSWIRVPQSVAIPFGSFESVLSHPSNAEIATRISNLKLKLKEGDLAILPKIRDTVLDLNAPQNLIEELGNAMRQSGMPFPGDEGEERWSKAWTAIKKVWASKWNERAYLSTRKAGINHEDLSMSVLVQEIIRADYAFVIHTTNPSNGKASELYAEVVKGLGEVLVGAFPGRALSFFCDKKDLNTPKVTGFPSKRVALFIDRSSIIFRSDSNGEDLDGYAGAGLYDSVPMDEDYESIVDYFSEPLVVDPNFQKSILNKIAQAGMEVEKLYGSAQDVEGVIKDGELYVVQTRPQM